MKDKEKQIEEMAKDLEPYIDLKREVFVSATEKKNVSWMLSEEDNKVIAESLVEQGYRKLPKDSVVLSREEWEEYRELKLGLILENLYICKQLIATEVVDCLRTHLPKDYEYLADWFEEHYAVNKNHELEYEQLKKYLEKPLTQASKETAEKILKEIMSCIDINNCNKNEMLILNLCKTLAEQFGAEIKK